MNRLALNWLWRRASEKPGRSGLKVLMQHLVSWSIQEKGVAHAEVPALESAERYQARGTGI